MSFHSVRTPAITLPRFSVGAMALVLALALMLAALVGIAAWTIRDPGYSVDEVAAARNAAYDQGVVAGRAQGVEQGTKAGASAGFEKGRKKGFAEGLMKGRKIGFTRGREVGYQEGYTAGQAAAVVPESPKQGKKN